MNAFLWVLEHKEIKEDTWTPDAKKAITDNVYVSVLSVELCEENYAYMMLWATVSFLKYLYYNI